MHCYDTILLHYCAVKLCIVMLYGLAVTKNISKYWSDGMDKMSSYRCNSTETVYKNDSTALRELTMSDLLLEAFQNTNNTEFINHGL